MNDEGEYDRNSDEHKGPWASELNGYGSRGREEQEHLEHAAPLGRPLLKMAEHDIADREDRCDQGDFKPRIHVRCRCECRGPTPELLPVTLSTAGSRRTRPFRARGSAGHPGSAAWHAPPPRRPASRTPVRSPRRGSSGHPPPSPTP